MSPVLQTYSIGVGIPSAEDLYNLQSDSDIVIGSAIVSHSEIGGNTSLSRVSAFAEVNALDALDGLTDGTAIGLSRILSTEIKGFSSTVIGVGIPSSVYGIKSLGTAGSNGSSSVSNAAFVLDHLDNQTVIGSSYVRSIDNLYSPNGEYAYTVYGYAQVIDGDEVSAGERVSFVDSETVSGNADPIGTAREGGNFHMIGDINGIAKSGAPASGGTLSLDLSPLDGPNSLLDVKFNLNLNTPDENTVVGSGIIRGFIDELGEVIGKSIIRTDLPDVVGQITSQGHADSQTVEGLAKTSATSSVVRFTATSNGSSLVTEGLSTFILNAAEFTYSDDMVPVWEENKSPDIAFKYSISAVEIYTYVPALAGYANGLSRLPGPTGPTGPVSIVAPINASIVFGLRGSFGAAGVEAPVSASALIACRGISNVSGDLSIPKSYYDNTVLGAPAEAIYDTGQYA